MKKLIGLLVVVVIVVIALAYFGFIPGLSNLFGGATDLGVKATAADYASASAKLDRERGELPSGSDPAGSIKFEGSHPVDASFTQEELTATIQSRDWAYNPFEDDVQFRINPDNTIEIAGTLIPENITAAAEAFGVATEDLSVVDKALGAIKGNPTFYIKTEAGVQNNVVSANLHDLKIGNLPVPAGTIPMDQVTGMVGDLIQSLPGMSYDSVTVSDGQLHFKGMYPDKTYYQP